MDWAIELSKDSKVNLIHRRDEFRGAQATIDKMNELVKSNKINLFTKYQLKSVSGKENLDSIEIVHDNKEIKNLKTDYVLGNWESSNVPWEKFTRNGERRNQGCKTS